MPITFYSTGGGGGGGVTEAATLAALDILGGTAGDLGLATDTGAYYIYDAVLGWTTIRSGTRTLSRNGNSVSPLIDDLSTGSYAEDP